jgi:hypothetical protein
VDPADSAACGALSARLGDLAAFLEQHAEHEEKFVHPAIEQVNPELSLGLESAHHELDSRMADALRAFSAMALCTDGERPERAVIAYATLSSFVAAYSAHMNDEETHAMEALWAGYDDVTLLAINQAIVASMPPEETARSFGVILPALNPQERFELLTNVRNTAPPPVFQGIWTLAQNVLSANDAQKLGRKLGLGVAA